MKYGSVCSGIEAATVAWHGLGWTPVWFSEIDSFPCKLLQHHYPDTPNLGDMTRYMEWHDDPIKGPGSIELLVGGTPCQSFSSAGLRKGLDDPRGNLMLTFGAIAGRYRPRWIVWENVPGVLSSNGGRDFGAFLGMLAELGYGFAYRVLDAQYFGVPQRRRRVFVVGYLGAAGRAAQVLFERESLSGGPAPRRKKRERVAPTASSGSQGSCKGDGQVEIAYGFLPYASPKFGIGLGKDISPTLKSSMGGVVGVQVGGQVRKLTPKEYERIQGFPDGYTDVPGASDMARYMALGNSMAVPVMRWIGERIQYFDSLIIDRD
jgi:DNA (cytosine-5)-methyltransferase 1